MKTLMRITPLLVVPFVLYHILVLSEKTLESGEVFSVLLISGREWTFTWSHVLLVVALALLIGEIAKATYSGSTSILDHMASFTLFVISLIEFLIWPEAGTSTFFLLMMIMVVDVLGGMTITISNARRDFGVG